MQNDIKNTLFNLRRIEWSCRRGMLELDVLLGNFFNENFSQLTIENQQLFIELLDYPDPVLFAWLLGHEIPHAEMLSIVTLIKQHARTRIQT